MFKQIKILSSDSVGLLFDTFLKNRGQEIDKSSSIRKDSIILSKFLQISLSWLTILVLRVEVDCGTAESMPGGVFRMSDNGDTVEVEFVPARYSLPSRDEGPPLLDWSAERADSPERGGK